MTRGLSYEEYKKRWKSFTSAQRDIVRTKAQWEHMTLWAVMNEWWRDNDPSPKDDLC